MMKRPEHGSIVAAGSATPNTLGAIYGMLGIRNRNVAAHCRRIRSGECVPVIGYLNGTSDSGYVLMISERALHDDGLTMRLSYFYRDGCTYPRPAIEATLRVLNIPIIGDTHGKKS